MIGFFHGYSNLEGYHPVTHRLLPDEHYRIFNLKDLSGLRNTRGIVIGTARSNPGKGIEKAADLDDPSKTTKLRNVYNAMVDLEIDKVVQTVLPDGRAASRIGCRILAERAKLERMIRLFIVDLL